MLSGLIRELRPVLDRHPKVKDALKAVARMTGRWKHSAAMRLPVLIQPGPAHLTLAVTAACNLRCLACRYGRDFMVGAHLTYDSVSQILDDAREAGVNRVRYYGGEPLLHPDLHRMIAYSTRLGMDSYVTTNGILLKQRIDELYDAGMRWLTLGFYGTGDDYDGYTQKPGRFAQLEESLAYVRDRYSDRFEMQLNWVLSRRSCTLEALSEAWNFAEQYRMYFSVDLVSYSIPFFTDGVKEGLRFEADDAHAIETVGSALQRLRSEHPTRFPQSEVLIRAIPDLLTHGPAMRLPCDAYKTLWVGADGTVQLCDVTFKLGNVNEKRLRDMLFGKDHRSACRDAFALRCPNCTCNLNNRIIKHAPSVRRYGSAPSSV
jgi:MoaA/NifB/PqqE/SkfB family radical SAM enzyme